MSKTIEHPRVFTKFLSGWICSPEWTPSPSSIYCRMDERVAKGIDEISPGTIEILPSLPPGKRFVQENDAPKAFEELFLSRLDTMRQDKKIAEVKERLLAAERADREAKVRQQIDVELAGKK